MWLLHHCKAAIPSLSTSTGLRRRHMVLIGPAVCLHTHTCCRLWSVATDGSGVDPDCRELRRGPQGNKPHSGHIDHLVMPRDGQVCDSTPPLASS